MGSGRLYDRDRSMNAQGATKPSSHQIGADLEADAERLLQRWGINFVPKKAFVTAHGNVVTPDFWLPATKQRPSVIIECKNFGVMAKRTSDSRRRKAQEALYLLVQIRRYCSETAQRLLRRARSGLKPMMTLFVYGVENETREEKATGSSRMESWHG